MRDLLHERNDFNLAYDVLIENNNISKWIHGHFHFHKEETYLDTEFISLSIGEFKKLNI